MYDENDPDDVPEGQPYSHKKARWHGTVSGIFVFA